MNFEKISMRKKIICLFLGCFVILLISVILILHNIYSKQIYKEMVQRGSYEDGLIMQQMEGLSQNVKSCCNNMILGLNSALGNGMDADKGYNQKIREKILNVIDSNFILFPDINQISVLYNNGDMYTKEKFGNLNYESDTQALAEQFKKDSIDTKGSWMFRSGEEPAVYYLKVLNEIKNNNQIGYVWVRLEEEMIYQNYQTQKTDSMSEIYIFNENKVLLSSNQRTLVESIYKEEVIENKCEESEKIYQSLAKRDKSYLIKEYLTTNGWTVISSLNIGSGMKNLRQVTSNIILTSLVLMCIFTLITMLILKKIMNPIVVLARHMRKTGVRPLCKIQETNSHDEIGNLISSFNQMVDMNEDLITQVKLDAKEKRRLELDLIQSQIKPHFLYNTLDTAFCLNEMERHSDANHVIKQLAGYYRQVLNRGDEWTSLAEELGAVEKYLEIQSVRYGELIHYNILVDPELMGFKIPKMTLQPLVENAIYHGIKPRRGSGHITIGGTLSSGTVKITVSDDGVGMSQAVFADILSGKQTGTDKESFGLKSVVERIRLYYGEHAKIICEEVSVGTKLVLSIDIRKEEEN